MRSGDDSQLGLMREDLRRSLDRTPIDPSKLTSFQRILLTTDGMVTEMLEAYFWERMTVVKLFQQAHPAREAVPELELEEGTMVLERRILLQGRMSRRNRIHARSMIVPDRLDEGMRDGLLNSEKAIGSLIMDAKLETFREILSCGRHPAGDLAACFEVDPEDFLIYRVYRVLAHRKPIMLITEEFPENETA